MTVLQRLLTLNRDSLCAGPRNARTAVLLLLLLLFTTTEST